MSSIISSLRIPPVFALQFVIAAIVCFAVLNVHSAPSIHSQRLKSVWFREKGSPLAPETSRIVQIIRPRLLNSSGMGPFYPSSIYLQMPVFKQTVTLKIRRRADLMAPTLTDRQHRPEYPNCYYSGSVNTSSLDSAALSLCRGLTGVFSIGSKEFYLTPINSNASDSLTFSRHKVEDSHYLYVIEDKENDKSMCSSGGPSTPSKDKEKKSRSRRSTEGDLPLVHYDTHSYSHQYVIEVMIAVSRSLQRRMGKGLKDYILTHMTVAATALRHQSIGAYITLKVSRIVHLDADVERTLDIPNTQKKAHSTYVKFCRWQNQQFSVRQWDVAILLIESRFKETATMGVTQRGNICQRQGSCLIARDWGLTTGFIIAHEIGHLLSAPHDEDCVNFPKTIQVPPIMSSRYRANRMWFWSACSRHYITKYLRSEHGACLRKTAPGPSLHQHVALSQPGERYNQDDQCQAYLGPGAVYCEPLDGILCQRLWCRQTSQHRCLMYGVKWADGTPCDIGKWCQERKCVYRSSDTDPVDGKWSDWSSWGECSQSCNGGIQYSLRNCTNPSPRNGGKYCTGYRKRFRSCNTHPCNNVNFESRDSQCRRLGKRLGMDITNVTAYIPILSDNGEKDLSENPCILECEFGPNRIKRRGVAVRDGTPCYKYQRACHSSLDIYTNDICVQDQCMSVGCDRIVGSKKKTDRCGVCGGDNSTCELVERNFNEQLRPLTAKTIMTLPKGATHVSIHQRTKDLPSSWESYRNDDDFYLFFSYPGGDNCYTMNKKTLQFGGSVMKNSGIDSREETIFFEGPLKENVEIRIVRASGDSETRLPYVRYTYYMAGAVDWSFAQSPWSECDRECQGMQVQQPRCVRERNGKAESEQLCRRRPRPEPKRRPCNEDCSYHWHSKPLTRCSARCGRGTQRVRFVCQRRKAGESRGSEVDHRLCKDVEGRAAVDELEGLMPCVGGCAATEWRYTAWSSCSATCDVGKAHRRAVCRDAGGEAWPDAECDAGTKGVLSRDCLSSHCPRWRVGDWSVCDADCGDGHQRRNVRCVLNGREVREEECRKEEKPEGRHSCRAECQWKLSPWSKCSVTCGNGVRSRQVRCMGTSGKDLPMYHCGSLIPRHVEPCEETACVSYAWKTHPPSECSVTCGVGLRHRLVVCAANDVERVEDALCAAIAKPRTEVHCDTGRLCHDWQVGRWSTCSVSCGDGYQFREVSCKDNAFRWFWSSAKCPDDLKPPVRRACRSAPCPKWHTEPWGKCDVKCGPGLQHRTVYCVRPNGERAPNADCHQFRRPEAQRRCRGVDCVRWQISEWLPCSVSCGKGRRTREITCVDADAGNRLPPERCAFETKPEDSEACDEGACPVWSARDWGECEGPCGEQTQTRVVECLVGPYRQSVPGNRCARSERPPVRRRCSESKLCSSSFTWHAAKWSKCSKTCGRNGISQRSISCVSIADGATVATANCARVPARPVASRPCYLRPCPNEWHATPWSECSVSCGRGIQRRIVECRAVTPEGWLSDVVNKSLCGTAGHPESTRECNLGDCGQRFFWYYGRWKPCTGRCNSWRYTTRDLKCIDRYGKEYSHDRCSKKRRPTSRRYCGHKDCYASSCSELRKFTQIKADGEYRLMIRKRMVKIYCHAMASLKPREFIVLKMGPSHNFANTSSLIAIFPSWCPLGNRLITDSCSACQYMDNPRSGLTVFHKIRLRLPSLTVKIDDLTFSNTEGNSPQLYGTAGDCFGRGYCPQGRFHIDLRGTDFRISKRTNWETQGTKAAQMIYKSTDRRTVSGRCGGYCGQCRPARYKLYLDIVKSN